MISGGDVNSETLQVYAKIFSSAAVNIPIDEVVVSKL